MIIAVPVYAIPIPGPVPVCVIIESGAVRYVMALSATVHVVLNFGT